MLIRLPRGSGDSLFLFSPSDGGRGQLRMGGIRRKRIPVLSCLRNNLCNIFQTREAKLYHVKLAGDGIGHQNKQRNAQRGKRK